MRYLLICFRGIVLVPMDRTSLSQVCWSICTSVHICLLHIYVQCVWYVSVPVRGVYTVYVSMYVCWRGMCMCEVCLCICMYAVCVWVYGVCVCVCVVCVLCGCGYTCSSSPCIHAPWPRPGTDLAVPLPRRSAQYFNWTPLFLRRRKWFSKGPWLKYICKAILGRMASLTHLSYHHSGPVLPL